MLPKGCVSPATQLVYCGRIRVEEADRELEASGSVWNMDVEVRKSSGAKKKEEKGKTLPRFRFRH